LKTAAYSMKNRIEDVDPMVLSLKAAVSGHLPDEKMLGFELCISEAMTNAVKHGTAGDGKSFVDLTLWLGKNAVSLEIYDAEGAAPFDLRKQARDLSEVDTLAESGRGLGLILTCADEVGYGPVGGRNRLILTFLKDLVK